MLLTDTCVHVKIKHTIINAQFRNLDVGIDIVGVFFQLFCIVPARVHKGPTLMASLSNYALRMARLSAQIFGEVVRTDTSQRSLKVVQLFKELPMAKRDEVLNWYPQHKIYFAMTQKLRYMGLYRYCSLLGITYNYSGVEHQEPLPKPFRTSQKTPRTITTF